MNLLVRLFGPRIRVTVGQDEVVFRTESKVVSVRPVLFVRDGIIVSIGTPPAEAAEELPVFVADAAARALRIVKLMQYGVQTVIGRSFTIKPVVSLRVERADTSLQEIKPALFAAGVADVLELPP